MIGKFAGDDIAPAELLDLTTAAYATFTHPAVTRSRSSIPTCSCWSCSTARPWRSRTWPCRFLARLYDKALKAQDRHLTIVAATSGDTGGAAVEAFRGASNARILVLFPRVGSARCSGGS